MELRWCQVMMIIGLIWFCEQIIMFDSVQIMFRVNNGIRDACSTTDITDCHRLAQMLLYTGLNAQKLLYTGLDAQKLFIVDWDGNL